MPKLFPPGTRDRFIELVCSGLTLEVACLAVGASKSTGSTWWRQCGRMELELADGRCGGLLAAVPAGVPGRVDRAPRQPLSSDDRAVIAAGLRQDLSYAAIGALIGRNRSVVLREVQRNSSENGEYHSGVAHRVAAQCRRRPKAFKLVTHQALCRRIEEWMDQGWSPGLIAQMLAVEHGADHTERVSHETIYRGLYVQTRGVLRADLHRQLSLKRPRRVPRSRDRKSHPLHLDFRL